MRSYFLAMPEPYWPKRKGSYKLSDADRNGVLVHVRCPYDKRQRLYVVADLIKAFGDMEVDDLDRKFKCRCGTPVAIKTMLPTASERQSIKLCRLVDIVTIKSPVWRDDP
ncbi:MAG: hypothetical protein AB7P20_20425 [Rhizobiaceae bacterium]